MSALPITGFYAGLLAILAVVLVMRVVALRHKIRVSIGDGGNDDLAHRIRVHGNFIETVPLALILLGLCEAGNLSIYALHALGVMLLAGRIAHAIALERGILRPRAAGMVLTCACFLLPALWLIWRFLQSPV